MSASRNDGFFPANLGRIRIMLFVDGENLAIRFAKQMNNEEKPPSHVELQRDVYVWSEFLNRVGEPRVPILRRYYYTSVQGDTKKLDEIRDRLKELGIEAPRVFKKNKSRGSKRVDISLTTEMLSHAHRGNYDLAVLVAGDEDYVPLVEAVIAEGARVVLWFVRSGLSPKLRRAVDHYFDLTNVLMATSALAMHTREIDYIHG